jgi:hypothetical protein
MNDQQPIEDILNNTKAKADAAFQNNLEEQLIARLHEKYDTNEDNPMMTKKKREHSVSRLPLTLAAAIIAIVLIGGLVILLNRSSNNAVTFLDPSREPDRFELTATELIRTVTQGASLQLGTPVATSDPFLLTATALIQGATQTQQAQQSGLLPTPTPAPMNANDDTGIPVMVAARDIAVGQVITAEMVYRVYWSREVANAAIEANPSYGGLFGNWEDVIGQKAQVFIPQWHPIQAEMIGSQPTDGIIDEGMALVTASINQVYSETPVNIGDVYDISIYCFNFAPTQATAAVGAIVTSQSSSCEYLINDAEIIYIGKVDAAPVYIPQPTVDTAPTHVLLTFVMRAEDAPHIQEVLNMGARASLQSSATVP